MTLRKQTVVPANPDLNPEDDDQLKQVILSAYKMLGVPSYGAFRSKKFRHRLFKGSGIALLRYCGVRNQMGYYALMNRLYLGLSATRYLKLRKRKTAHEDDRWCQDDADHLQSSIVEGYSDNHEVAWNILAGSRNEFNPEAMYIARIERERLSSELRRVLTERQYYVLKMRYGLEGGEEKTFREVGKDMRLSSARMGQIAENAIERSREQDLFFSIKRVENDLIPIMIVWRKFYRYRKVRYTRLLVAHRSDVEGFPQKWEDSADYKHIMSLKPY